MVNMAFGLGADGIGIFSGVCGGLIGIVNGVSWGVSGAWMFGMMGIVNDWGLVGSVVE